jgi:hypothetical protein
MGKSKSVFFLFSMVCCLSTKVTFCQNQLPATDSPKYIVMDYDFRGDTTFLQNVSKSSLSEAEVKAVDLLLKGAVANYNKGRSNKSAQVRSLTQYHIQLIPVASQKGEKLVWVNAFCPSDLTTAWQKEVIHLAGGGNCVFAAFFNLTTGKLIWMQVHDYA